MGRQAPRGYCVRASRSHDLRCRLFCANRAMGMGQSETHGLGLLYYSAVSVERYPRALGVSGTGSDVRCTLRFRIYHLDGRADRGTPRFWTH